MISRRFIGVFVLFVMSVATPLSGSRADAAGDRFVSASIECVRELGAEPGLPVINVTVENQSGLTLYIAYLQAFGAGPILETGPTGLRLENPVVDQVVEIPNGESATYNPIWAGVDLKRSDVIVALIVTSAGNFLPSCSEDGSSQTYTYDADTPQLEGEEAEESARIAAATIGQLESWRAYPALYTLLYPGAQDAISFDQIACWYAERFGPPATGDVSTIYSTEVKKVEWETWTWTVTGEEFQQSAVVTYAQEVGKSAKSAEALESDMHLVRVDGIWRWFFGSSAEGVARLTGNCEIPATS